MTVENGATVKYHGKVVSDKLHSKILSLIAEKKPVRYLSQFLDNLHANPSEDAINELYDFLEANNLPITEDGHFLAYKTIRDNYKDHHSNSMDNSVGKVIAMSRANVNANRNETCSTGLHFCQSGYLDTMPHGRTVIVKINPADVVSIPSDYKQMKGRACRYLILAEIAKGDNVRDALNKAAITTKAVLKQHAPKSKNDTIPTITKSKKSVAGNDKYPNAQMTTVCGLCGAGVGFDCQQPDGRKAPKSHAARPKQ